MDNNGTLDQEEFRAFMRKLDVKEEDKADAIFYRIDKDRNRDISLHEFIYGLNIDTESAKCKKLHKVDEEVLDKIKCKCLSSKCFP